MRINQPRDESLASTIYDTKVPGGMNMTPHFLDPSVAYKYRGSRDDAFAVKNSRILNQDIFRSEEAWGNHQEHYQTY
jgi:hypothetical protein